MVSHQVHPWPNNLSLMTLVEGLGAQSVHGRPCLPRVVSLSLPFYLLSIRLWCMRLPLVHGQVPLI